MKAPLPPTEEARLEALLSYNILDTPPEKQFDDITRLASFITGCPMAIITLLDSHRQWFKSKVGLQVDETSRDVAFCAHAILQRDLFIVADSLDDPRFRDNPLVTGDPRIRYYGGIPLVTQNDHALGTLCVLDRVPRNLQPEQLDALRTLAHQVVSLLDLRRAISEVSTAWSALRQRERDLAAIVENSQGLICMHDLEGKLVSINPAGAQVLGYRADELVGRNLLDFLAPEAQVRFPEYLAQIRQTGSANGRMVVMNRAGERHVLLYRNVLQTDGAGNAYVLGHGIDDTIRVMAEAELIRAKRAADDANRAKSDFLAKMSHEIRTPMNGILGMTELVLATPLNPEQQEYLEIVRSSGEALLEIINDILDFSKIEAGKLHLDKTQFSLRDKLGETMLAMSFRAMQKGNELIFRIAPDVPDSLHGDIARLRQVVINLVGNAAKFTENGEILVDVSLARTDAENVLLTFSVSDTGIGIPPEKCNLIFAPFEQADTSTSRRFGGTGLGLPISRQLVELMGGELHLESKPGKGSRFYFSLPLGIAGTARMIDSTAAENVDVLLVESSSWSRKALEELLRSWGARVTTFGSLKEAADRRPSGGKSPLLLIDEDKCRGPGSAELQAFLHRNAMLPHQIIVLTCAVSPDEARRYRESGIRCVRKPPKHSELLAAIREASGMGTVGAQKNVTADEEPLPRLRVLLAEDNVVNQKLAVTMLQKMGMSVTVADNGRRAVAATANQTFDMIFMDVQMPELDGLAATGAIREREAQERRSRSAIIALTAHAMQGDRERCLNAGMDAVITKPLRARDMRETIRSFVASGRVALEPEPPPSVAIFDRESLLDRLDGDEGLAREVIDLYRASCRPKIELLRQALDVGDPAAVESAAHSLKGSSRNISADRVGDVCDQLEQMGASARLEGAGELVRRLEDEILKLEAILDDGVFQ